MPHLLELLPETVEHICSYCSVSDLLNVACCNKEHYNFIRFLLWRVVKVPWYIEKDSLQQRTRYIFKFTRSLSFFYNNEYIHESPEKKWDIVADYYEDILKSCHVEKLTCLRLETIFSDRGLQLTSELLKNIRELSLHRCHNITESGWQLICSFTHLKQLELFDCTIQDSNIEEIVKELNLKKLMMNQCQKLSSSCLKHISRFTSLEVFSLSCWRFKDVESGLEALSTMKSLKKLTITGYHHATNDAITLLNSLTSLNELDLSCCSNLNDIGLSKLSLLPCLRKLNICDCGKITDVGLTELTVLSSLKILNVSGCWKLTDCGLSQLSILNTLHELNVGGCRFITDIGISDLINLKSLKKLNISGCRYVTDIGLAQISTLVLLSELCVGGCHVTDLGISQLVSLKLLKTLSISECNKVTDFGLAQISKISSLKRLNIHGCTNVTYIGLSQLTDLKLNELNLKDCDLSDELVKEFCAVAGMKELLGIDGSKRGRILSRNHRLWLKQLKQRDNVKAEKNNYRCGECQREL